MLGLLCGLHVALVSVTVFRSEENPALHRESHVRTNGKEEMESFPFAACLIVKDDNPILPEWLAYHYTVMPLRYLIVAIDPLSITSPMPILDKFRELGMDITVWHDRDFNRNARVWYRAAAAPDDPPKHKHEAYMFRQNEFYWECLTELSERNERGEKLTWTMIIDTDEYVVFNHYLKSERERVHNPRAHLPRVGTTTVAEYILQQTQRNDSSVSHALFFQECSLAVGTVPQRKFLPRYHMA